MHKGAEILQVPVCFVFMSRRQAKDYTRVFKRIKKLMGDTCIVAEIVSDFEKGILEWCGLCFPLCQDPWLLISLDSGHFS